MTAAAPKTVARQVFTWPKRLFLAPGSQARSSGKRPPLDASIAASTANGESPRSVPAADRAGACSPLGASAGSSGWNGSTTSMSAGVSDFGASWGLKAFWKLGFDRLAEYVLRGRLFRLYAVRRVDHLGKHRALLEVRCKMTGGGTGTMITGVTVGVPEVKSTSG